MKKVCIIFSVFSVLCLSKLPLAEALPIHLLPGLDSITIYERTSSINSHVFGVNDPRLSERLTTLNTTFFDFGGAPSERYDVFYSNSDGTFNANGEFLSIEAVFSAALPNGGALNVSEVELNFSNGTDEFANQVVSFLQLGNNANPATIGNAVDGNLSTHTVMGNTIGQNQRLRLTLGFASNDTSPVVPEPASLLLMGSGFAGMLMRKKFLV